MSVHYRPSPRRVAPPRGAIALSIVAAPIALAILGSTATSHADPLIRRFALRGELGLGASLPQFQREQLGYGLVVQGSGRFAFNIIDPLAVQASFTSWYLPNDRGGGQQFSYTLGLRFEPRLTRFGRGFIDANAGLGQSIGLLRFTFDVGLGFEFDVTRWLAVGPVVRYGFLAASSADYPSSAQYVTAGASVTLRWPFGEHHPVAAPTPTDRDGDGVVDEDDQCPTVPAGDEPDAARRGCPEGDRDGDGVRDRDDQCVDVPAGEHADPARRGCPIADRDQDGIVDANDQCPDTAQGDHPDPERAGCPDGDRDQDRVLDHADQCREEPAGLHPDAARPGCPQPDRDHDGVPDATDHCPEQPGAPDPNPTRNGCPGLVRLEGSQLRITQPVFFATNRDVILPRSLRVLQAVASALRAVPEIHRVSIEGHTDDVGDDAANMALSERRAQSVMRWLTEHGVEANRLEAHGYGETRPLAQGATPAARAQNRRVEFHITDPAQSDSTIRTNGSATP
jgi:outer membrane protein OmpA-like peptidoglycan-associated protein